MIGHKFSVLWARMGKVPQKILIIRLSSIGDIVLTSPIVRALRRCYPAAELHFLTKKAFVSLVQYDPRLAKVHAFEGDLNQTIAALKLERFDWVVDLHRNIRSRLIKLRLGIRAVTYSKDRWPILLYTKLGFGKLPVVHTVERYARALKPLGCALDEEGLEFFLPAEAREMAGQIAAHNFVKPPIAVVLGGNYATKRWPKEYFVELLNGLDEPVMLLGGKSELDDAQWIADRLTGFVFNAVAQYDLLLSAALMERSQFVLTHDTGLMHIATALGCKIFSIWGNTVPELGFSPYKAKLSVIIENKSIDCRPCTKLGYDQCPKGHFKCMRELLPAQVHHSLQSHQAAD
jgi:ADP-heptose:LPS heptosyltransferase